MTDTPGISVVLPVRNGERTIERAVRSILTQTFDHLELVVVEDGSTDPTPQILAGIDDSRLSVLTTGPCGVAAAANLATQTARAPIIARMDADDIAHPERLEQQWTWLHESGADVVGSQVRIESTAGPVTDGMRRYERWINEDTLHGEQIAALRFVEFPLVNPTLMARREYFELGFAGNAFPEDYDLMLRAAERGMRFGKCKERLLTWIDSPGRLTRNDHRYTDDAFMECRRHHFLQGPLAGITQADLWGAGATGKSWQQWLARNDIAVRHLYDVSPKKIGRRIHGVTVRSSDELVPPDGTLLIVAVGAAGARTLIDEFIVRRGYVSGADAWFVA